MTTLILARDSTTDKGTFGTLTMDGQQIAVTCEPPWRGNLPEVSCIPPGLYSCIPHNSPDHPHTWEVTNVPDRSEILIHNGNDISDTAGCILVGDSFGTVDRLPAVMNSNLTLDKLRELLPLTFFLNVINPS